MDVTRAGDDGRRRQIEELPETVEVTLSDGTTTSIPFRVAARQADADWVRFRESEIYGLMLGEDQS